MSETVQPPPDTRPIQVKEGRTCEFCIWWGQESGYEYRGGICRKREPMIGTIMLTTDGYNEKTREGTWPTTKKDDWCGAFNSKPPKFIAETVKEAPGVPAQA